MKKRIYAFLTVFIILLVFVIGLAISQKDSHSYTVGICQYARHESLDAATQGFRDALNDAMDGKVIFDEQNANGDLALCTEIINQFIFKDVNLILANSTNSLQIAAGAGTEIPILGTAVTEYDTILQSGDPSMTAVKNISGTSDMVPPKEQAAMISELFPNVSKIGMIYCSSEPNSQYQANALQEQLRAMGYSCESFLFANSNDLSSVTMTAVSSCDVLFIPTDNTVAANAGLIANICIPEGIPVIAGDESTCQTCGAVTLSVNYYDLGYATGKMAAEILAEGRSVSELPVQYASSFTKKYNKEICRQLNLEIPADYTALETELP